MRSTCGGFCRTLLVRAIPLGGECFGRDADHRDGDRIGDGAVAATAKTGAISVTHGARRADRLAALSSRAYQRRHPSTYSAPPMALASRR